MILRGSLQPATKNVKLTSRFWLLVFDLDGTLIDSSLDLCLAVNAAMRKVGAPELPHDLITGYVGDGAAMLVRRALGDAGDLDTPAAARTTANARFERAYMHFLEFYREHKLDNTRLYEGVLPALDCLRESAPALPMAVLTNKPVRPSREICEALGIARFFFANYGGDSFATKKPDPAGLQALMAQARNLQGNLPETQDIDAHGVLMIGDSEADVLTARRAGARSLGCLYGLSPRSLELAEPDLVCSSPREWPVLLGCQ